MIRAVAVGMCVSGVIREVAGISNAGVASGVGDGICGDTLLRGVIDGIRGVGVMNGVGDGIRGDTGSKTVNRRFKPAF